MIYGMIWRRLPGPFAVRLLLAIGLALAVVAFCFLWLFPRIAPSMPFNDNTVDPAAAPDRPAYSLHHAPQPKDLA